MDHEIRQLTHQDEPILWEILYYGLSSAGKDEPPSRDVVRRPEISRYVEGWGRVGDSPLIGAGTYADNKAAAVSCTGAGEYFIRLGVAHRICALVEYAGMSLQAAADQVVQEELTALGGDGGIIAVAPDGQMAWSFNTEGMYRARVCEGGCPPAHSPV